MLIQLEEQREKELAPSAEGWERRFTADLQRIQEAIELYRQLGYEVRVESVRQAAPTVDCGPCHAAALPFKTIYTRKKRT
jgi:hypothetical protein